MLATNLEVGPIQYIIKKADAAFALCHWKEAFSLYQQAENLTVNGHVYYRSGLLFQNGYGADKDEKKAQHYFRLALEYIPALADAGDCEAQSDLGFMYDNGYGVGKDQVKALQYYRLAADQGVTRAQNNVGCYYYEGIIVKKDKAQAAKYFKLAADSGNAGAQCSLASMYDEGDALPLDKNLAFKYYLMAADQKYAIAQHNVAYMYYYGEGTEVMKDKAFYFYELAAMQGDIDAMLNVAKMYENGDGVKKNLLLAIKYYKRISNTQSKKQLKKIYRGEVGTEYRQVFIHYMFIYKWPKTHYLLHPNCKNAIIETIISVKNIDFPKIPKELILQICKWIAGLWNEMHNIWGVK